MTKSIAEEFEEEFVSRLSQEDRRAMIKKIVDDATREGRVTPSQVQTMAREKIYARLQTVLERDLASGDYDEHLSVLTASVIIEFLKDPKTKTRLIQAFAGLLRKADDLY